MRDQIKIKDLLSGGRLEDDGLLSLLKNEGNLPEIAEAADGINRRVNSGRVTYVVNRNINFTNVCNLNCKFCGYKRTKGAPDAFLLGYDKILEKISDGMKIGIDEICVTGGINPDLKPDYYFGLLKTIKRSFPRLHIHAFSPQEIYELSRMTGKSREAVISALAEAGLNSMPGTAAEILAEKTRKYICPEKIGSSTWAEIIKTAHKTGIKTSATVLFGHLETESDLVHHLSLIRNIQDETRGFTEFITLPFISSKTPLRKKVAVPFQGNVQRVFKFYSILRLYLDNFKNIQVSWPKIGVENAARSLDYGVNDFGGTLMEENITKSAGGGFGEYLPERAIIEIIKSAGKIPVRRNTLYETGIYEETMPAEKVSSL